MAKKLYEILDEAGAMNIPMNDLSRIGGANKRHGQRGGFDAADFPAPFIEHKEEGE